MGAMTSSLAAKLAFFPPNPPSYHIIRDPATGKLRFQEIAPLDNVEVMFLETTRKQRIAAMFVRNPRARLTVLYSHGNAADLGQVHDLYVELSNMLRVNLLGYDYTGYGESSGKPTEVNTYADIEAAFTCLETRYAIRREDIVLYGQSVGSGPTVELASHMQRVRGVVLHSPIMSGIRVLYDVKTTMFFDVFTNIDKIPKVECPVFVMHGTADDVVDVSHGRALAQLCKHPFEPLFIEGARHCDLEFFPEYLKQLRKFIAYAENHPPPPPADEDAPRRSKKKPGWTTPLSGFRNLAPAQPRPPVPRSATTPSARSSSSWASPLFFFSPAATSSSTPSRRRARSYSNPPSPGEEGEKGEEASRASSTVSGPA